jgi:hypothetical protein
MRKNVISLVFVSAALAGLPAIAVPGAGAPAGDLVAKIHWVGTDQIGKDPSGAKWNELWAVPETAALREETLRKLATTPFRVLKDRIGENTNDFAALLQPLADDLLKSEWYAEMRGAPNPVPEMLLAIKLNAARAGAWRTNLATVLESWTHIQVKGIQADGFQGWELVKHDNPNRIRLFLAGEWVVFGWGQDDLQLQPAMLQRLKDRKRPVDAAKDYWLDAWVDWTRLESGKFLVGTIKFPKTRLVLQGRKDFVRPQLTMQFPEPLGLKPEPWKVPAGLIHNPIISFTAVRGIAPRLGELDAVKRWNVGTLPGQYFIWSADGIPYETSLAAPVADGSNYLARLQPGLVSWLNQVLSVTKAKLEAHWTNNMVAVDGVPFVAPTLRAVREPAGDYLVASLLPSPPRKEPLPPALLNELNSHSNRVYYDWEITEARIQKLRAIRQLYFLARTVGLPASDSTAQKWLNAVKAKLGNCATEVNQTAPNELTLLRNSTIGLSALELTGFVQWLEAPEFPLNMNVKTTPLGKDDGRSIPLK